MSAEKSRGFIDVADVLDHQPGAREVLTVDGDFVPVSRIHYGTEAGEAAIAELVTLESPSITFEDDDPIDPIGLLAW
ncbi:MAG TPA: hypothetical protein VJR27_02735 [Candidatus Saccharimonadales bacterium]|nr:hypothetical protein [Candidatus Saccharimonadales bacterium]